MTKPDIDAIKAALIDAGMNPNAINELLPKSHPDSIKDNEQKKVEAEKLKAKGDWYSFIHHHDRPQRLQEFWNNQNDIPEDQYWKVLGSVLTDLEGSTINRTEILMLLMSRKNPQQMMNEKEQGEFSKLPEMIPVYRGCKSDMQDGLSWTTDREKALWFANRYAKLNPKVVVVSGEVPKSKVFAYFLGRGESEILISPGAVQNKTVEKIKK